jgi:capsule polysaccharide modification protein KpsS
MWIDPTVIYSIMYNVNTFILRKYDLYIMHFAQNIFLNLEYYITKLVNWFNWYAEVACMHKLNNQLFKFA